MAPYRPQVIEKVRLAELVQYIQENSPQPSVLVICATKEQFIQQLLAACVDTDATNADRQTTDGVDEHVESEPTTKETHDLRERPTLLQLARSRTVKLVFCRDITHLRAYLASVAVPKSRIADNGSSSSHDQIKKKTPMLAILNPIDTHRFTSAFSAQGLNRTFSLAVEAAHATKSRLLMVEDPSCRFHEADHTDDGYEIDANTATAPPLANLWDEEVSILNVTTKSFGAGGRGWVGRTVTVRSIAERWCTFTTFPRT